MLNGSLNILTKVESAKYTTRHFFMKQVTISPIQPLHQCYYSSLAKSLRTYLKTIVAKFVCIQCSSILLWHCTDSVSASSTNQLIVVVTLTALKETYILFDAVGFYDFFQHLEVDCVCVICFKIFNLRIVSVASLYFKAIVTNAKTNTILFRQIYDSVWFFCCKKSHNIIFGWTLICCAFQRIY